MKPRRDSGLLKQSRAHGALDDAFGQWLPFRSCPVTAAVRYPQVRLPNEPFLGWCNSFSVGGGVVGISTKPRDGWITSGPTTNSKGVLLRLPVDTLWISIDDEEKPFLLKNLDQRFEAESLTTFLQAYAVQCSKNKKSPSFVVESLTKTVVVGEDTFNECLSKMTTEHNVSVVILPMPTGDDPNMEIRRFSDEFNQQEPLNQDKKQRTKR